MPISESEIKRILIVQVAGIGDLVMATPTLRALRNRFSKSKISLLTAPRAKDIVVGSPYIDEIYTLASHKYFRPGTFLKPGSLRDTLRLIRKLRQKHFDLMINLYNLASIRGTLRMAFLFSTIGAKYRAGRDTDRRGFFYNLKVPERSLSPKHEVERMLDIARALGAKIRNKDLEIPLFAEDRNYVTEFFSQYQIRKDDLVIGINPGAFRPSREWDKKKFALVADELSKKYQARIIITGGKRDVKLANDISNLMITKPIIVAGKTTLKQLAVLIQKCKLFITNDSGPMHIAVTVKTPLIALCGPGPLKYAPYGDGNRYIVIKKEVDCSPCYKMRCRSHKCMELIAAGEVLQAAEKQLDRFFNQ